MKTIPAHRLNVVMGWVLLWICLDGITHDTTDSEKNGYLASLLSELDIDVSSQLLVASKTSLQIAHISPATPRAIYFNDKVYVGWVQGSPAIELSAVDPKLGAVFYTVEHEPGMGAKFEHKMGVCLQCHKPVVAEPRHDFGDP